MTFIAIGAVTYSQAYNFRQLSIQNGLPQSQAYAIIFDSTEHAWIGTQGGGLCRYDGTEFIYFTKNDSLLSMRIYALELIENEIWIGQKGGITIFDQDGKFRKNFRLIDPAAIVSDIIQYGGITYLATDKGLMVKNKNEFDFYTDNPNLVNVPVSKFFKSTGEPELWLCTTQGLLNFSNPFSRINVARGLNINQVECAVDFHGAWVIGTYGGGVSIYDKEKLYVPELLEDYRNEIITCLFISESNEIWIGTINNGIFVYSPDNNSVKNYRSENGLANNNIKTILSDRWNNIWIGTSGGGVSIFQNSPFIKYSRENGLTGNYVYTVVNDENNNIWVGTEGTGGALRINDSSATLFDEDYGFHSAKVRTIFYDSDGDIWLGTEEKGLGIFRPSMNKDTIFSYSQANGLTSNWIKCFAENEKTKEIFISTINGGILRVKKGKDFPQNVRFNKYKITKGKLPDRLSYIFFFQNNLWFVSTENEYGFIKNGEVIFFNKPDVNFRNAAVRNDMIWMGSTDNGILQLQVNKDSVINEKWIETKDGLRSNNIYQLLWDKNDLWVGTEKGLDRIEFDSVYTIIEVTHFGSEEGFEGVETNSNASFRDANGNLWFGTVNGLYLYKGVEINYAQKEDPVLLMTDFRLFYESIEQTEFADYYDHGKMVKKLILPYDKNHVGFTFKAIHYTHSKNIRYRYRLRGLNAGWSPPTTNHEAPFPNLNPGDYSFEVQASINDEWNGETIKIDFTIDQPYWEKFWFKFAYYSVIVFVIALIILIIFIRVRRNNKRLQLKFEMEKNLIELEQKALRLQMNPHFIFNVLNSIHNLIILNDPDKARYALSKFSKLMRRVLENSREKLISIDNEIETLENYVQLEKLTSNTDVTISFDVDENIDSSEEILPPLMLQPFVENAIIHGLRQLDKTGEIKISFKLLSEHILECSIEDNGKGREHAALINSQKESYHKSTALKVTQERLSNINQKATFIPFEIIDLKDEKNEPRGTRIVIRLLI